MYNLFIIGDDDMDIEIKNESQALNICGNAKSDKIKQLNSHISTLNSLINKIKVNWSSTGTDQASYIAELEKQANNLQEISNQSYRFFDVIERYVDSTQKTSQKTVGSGGSSGSSSSGSAGGVGAGVAAGAAKAAGAIKQTANSMAGLANGGSSSGGKVTASTSSGGTVKPTLDPGVPNTNGGGIVGTVGVGGSSGGGSSYTGGTGGTSSGSGSYTGGTSGTGSSTISSVHGNGSGASTLGGATGATAEVGGASGSASSGGISSAAGTSGTVTTAASEIFTSDKLDGVVPKLSVPMSSGGTSGSKAVPIVSGGIAAGAVGLGAAAILKKAPAAKPEKNLEIDAWEESKEAPVEVEASTMEQKLGELTFEDIIM